MQWEWLPDHDNTTRDIWHVQPVGHRDSATRTLDQSRVLYVFRGSMGMSGRIRLPGFTPDLYQDEQFYGRTAEGLWTIRWKVWLKPSLFRQTHASAWVNLRKQPTLVVDELEWKYYQFTFTDGHVECVPISRNFYSLLREEYRGLSIPLPTVLLPSTATTKLRQPKKTPESIAKTPESPGGLDVKVPQRAQSAHTDEHPQSEPS